MHKNRITHVSDSNTDFIKYIIEAIKKTGKGHSYIHLDLDVLNPELFPYVPVPECGGVSFENLKECLEVIRMNFDVVGFGLYEYAPQKEFISEMEWFTNYGILLSA